MYNPIEISGFSPRFSHPPAHAQTFGGRFTADGRLSGPEAIQTISCDQSANTCTVPVPAPGAALVFVSAAAQAGDDPTATQTYSTTAVTNRVATMTVDPTALARSNGHMGDMPLAGTSKNGASTMATPSATLSTSHLLYLLLGIGLGLLCVLAISIWYGLRRTRAGYTDLRTATD